MALSAPFQLRKTGIPMLGDLPWGSHLCQFFRTKEDLLEILVPYFKAGLENNEFCMWVTAEPLSAADAVSAMTAAVPDFPERLKNKQMEIVPHDEWYLKGGKFDLKRVLDDWLKKLDSALGRGFDGIRVTGNTAWLERKDWSGFEQYEAELNDIIGGYRVLAVCSYSLGTCTASDVIDVVANHRYAILKHGNAWSVIETSTHKIEEEELKSERLDLNKKLLERTAELEGLLAAKKREADERAKQAKELAEASRMLDAFFTSTITPMAFLDRDFDFIRVNAAYAKTDERDVSEFPGHNHFEYYPSDAKAIFEKVVETKEPYSAEARPFVYAAHPERGVTYWDWTLYPVIDDAGEVDFLVFSLNNVTRRKLAEMEVADYRKNLESKIAERTAELSELNKELDAFSYSVSHDLKVPLRAVDGYSRMLLERSSSLLDDESKRLIGEVRGGAQRMTRLIEDILVLSHAVRWSLAPRTIDMDSIVAEVMDELKPLIAGRKVEFNAAKLPPAVCDPIMIRQAMENLLSNAVKFTRTREDAVIEVGAEDAPDETLYYIKDNGVGFDMAYAGKLFGVFQRLHGEDEFEGTGIGLAIVKRVITRHGGRVGAEGRPGEGARFFFTLPKKEAQDAGH